MRERAASVPTARAQPVSTAVFEQGLGMFSSIEDAASMDEVVSLAYAERRRPSKDQPLDL